MDIMLWEPALKAKPKRATTLFSQADATSLASGAIARGSPCDVFETSAPGWVGVRVREGASAPGAGYAPRSAFGALRLPRRLPPLPWRLAMGHAPPAIAVPLFNVTGVPEPQDIRQGLLGDCAVLAAFSAVARRYPELLRQAFSEKVPNAVTVHYYNRGENDRPLRRAVSVSSRVLQALSPIVNTSWVARFRRAPEHRAAWPAILEKAYALSTGDGTYARIDGHDAKHVFPWLLGCSADTLAFRHRRRDAAANLADLAARYTQGECLVVYDANHAYEVVGFEGPKEKPRCLLYSSQGSWPGARGGRLLTYGRRRFARQIIAFTATHGARDVATCSHSSRQCNHLGTGLENSTQPANNG